MADPAQSQNATQQAFITVYRDAYLRGFEKRQTLLRDTVITDIMRQGEQVVFLVTNSFGQRAIQRDGNGQIPSRDTRNTQIPCPINAYYDKVERTAFDIFRAQGNQLEIMRMESMEVMNREIDYLINRALAETPNDWGAAKAVKPEDINAVKATLETNFAGGSEVVAVVTPRFVAQLKSYRVFTSSDYRPMEMRPYAGDNVSEMFSWNGIKFIVNAEQPGTGTADAKCYMYNKRAVGHAADMASASIDIERIPGQDATSVMCKIYMGSVLLQPSGVIAMPHNDTAPLVATGTN